MDPRWLCEAEMAPVLPWYADAPWVAANAGGGYEFTGRSPARFGLSLFRARASLGDAAGDEALRQLFYGNPIDHPGEMVGLTAHYGTRDPNEAQNAVNVFDAGGAVSGRLCSMWLLGWSLAGLFMASPNGEPPRDTGRCCVVVRDWRWVVRVANVDTTDDGFDPFAWMAQALFHLPRANDDKRCRPGFYVNSGVAHRIVDRMTRNGLKYDGQFRGVPIRGVHELRGDENRV